jgi:hypothetical protein
MRTTALTVTTKSVAVALAVATISACGVRKTTTRLNPSYSRAPTCEEAIEVFNHRKDVPHDYYELAFIQASGNSVYTSEGKLEEQVRIGAAKVGANAVIINPSEATDSPVKVLGAALGANTAAQKVSALAIYMPADAGRVRAQCGRS